MQSTFEGDNHTQKVRLQNWICLYQDAKMMEDESIRSYFGRIVDIFLGIGTCGGENFEDGIIMEDTKDLETCI